MKTALLLMALACALNAAGAQSVIPSKEHMVLTLPSSEIGANLTGKKYREFRKEALKRAALQESPEDRNARMLHGPQVGDDWIVSMDTEAFASREAYKQWSRDYSKELDRLSDGPSDKFIARKIAKSHGQVINLTQGTHVHILSRDAYVAELRVDDAPHKGETYFMSVALFTLLPVSVKSPVNGR